MTQSTSYDLPNYVGELFLKQERPNALLRLIGAPDGPNGGQYRTVENTEFPMGVNYTLPGASQPALLEGAAATASQLALTQASNVVQIFQEAIDMTYSLQARKDSIGGVAIVPGGANGELAQPNSKEWQIQQKVKKVARDMNYTFLNGAYQKPANNATARKTRGLIAAVTTNLAANGGTPRAISKAIIQAALLAWMDTNGMFNLGGELFLVGPAAQLDKIFALYEAGMTTNVDAGRTVAGLQFRTIYERMATLQLVYDFDMPAGKVLVLQPRYCRPVSMPIPGKGVFFREPLAKVGSSDQEQLYGEFGLDYTDEIFHGVIADLS
jgi:hypothetical protein